MRGNKPEITLLLSISFLVFTTFFPSFSGAADFNLLTTLTPGSTIDLNSDYICSDGQNHPLRIWDTSDFSFFTELSSYHQKLWPFADTTISDDDYIYNACGSGSHPGVTDLYIWDKSDFSVHTVLAGLSGCPSALFVDNSYIYAGTSNHFDHFGSGQYLHIISQGDYSLQTSIPGWIKDVYADENYIFVADLADYPKVYSKSDFSLQTRLPNGPSVVNAIFADAESIYTGGGHGAVGCNVYVWNYSDFSAQTILQTGEIVTFEDICSDSGNRYIFGTHWYPPGGSESGLFIWDRSDFSLETHIIADKPGKAVAADNNYVIGSWGGIYTIPVPDCPEDMIAYWRAEDNALDSVGTNDGLLVGDTGYKDGKVGRAFSLDGDGDYIDCGNDSSIQIGGSGASFSLEAWAKRISLDQHDTILGQGEVGINRGLHFAYRANNTFTFAFYLNDLDSFDSYTDTGEWHHWAGTYNGVNNERKLFRDGILIAEDSAEGDYIGSGNMYIGSPPWLTENHFEGMID